MFTQWIGHEVLDSRLDAFRYTPDFVDAYKRLLSAPVPSSRLDTIRNRDAAINYGILQPREFLSDGVPMVRAVDVQNPFVDRDKVVLVPKDVEAPYHRSRLMKDDVLISIAGTLGNVGFCPAGWTLANVNQSVARIRIGPGWDPMYVVAFLLSPLGQVLLAREAVGTVQRHLNIEDVREVRIPRAAPEIQRAVGNKIRKADRLRSMAQNYRGIVSSDLDDWYGTINLDERGSFGWLDRDHLSSRRIDAWFNQPKYVQNSDVLNSRRDLVCVSTFCRAVSTTVDWTTWPAKMFDYFEIGGIDGQPGSIVSQQIAVSDAPSRAKYTVAAWDILVSTVRPNLKNIALVPEAVTSAVCSSGFSVLRAESPSVAGYLWACLSHDVATAQLMRWNTDGTYPAIERSVPLEVLVPLPGEHAIESTGEKIVNAIRWTHESAELVHAAKQDAESIISQTLDVDSLLREDELVVAWLEISSNNSVYAGRNGPK